MADKIGKTRLLISFFERKGITNKYTLQDVSSALRITVDEIQDLQIENKLLAKKANLKTLETLPPAISILDQLKTENDFLKSTINQQWEIITELTKKITEKK